MSGTQSPAQHLAAALLYQAAGDWACVAQEYQAAMDMLDPADGPAINNAKAATLQTLVADASMRSRGYVAQAGMPTCCAITSTTAMADLSTAIAAIGTSASADAGSLLAA